MSKLSLRDCDKIARRLSIGMRGGYRLTLEQVREIELEGGPESHPIVLQILTAIRKAQRSAERKRRKSAKAANQHTPKP